MKKETLSLFAWIVLGAFSILITWSVWSLLYPYEILTVKPGSWVVQNPGKGVARGATLLVYLDYCVLRQESPRVDMAIEQVGRITLLDAEFPAAVSVGCRQVMIPLATIPSDLPIEFTTAKGNGKARLHVTLRYRVNALRELQYHFATDEFFIDP